MARVDLSVYRVTSKGRTYYYAWRGAGAPRLLSPPGSDEFVAELNEALAARVRPDTSKVAGLISTYKAADEWKGLADKTKRNWVIWLDRIYAHFGNVSVGAFDRPLIRVAIRKWRDKFKATPRSADMGLQVLSRLMSFAVAEGLLGSNPVSGVPHLYRSDRSELIWSSEDIALLEQGASKEVMWAVRLAMLTGLRQGDLLRLSWSHVGPLSIQMKTGKSRQRKTTLIPLHGELKALLAEIPKRATTVLTNQAGRPWRSGFGASWNTAVKAAEIDLHFHDLRGTAATKLYLADFSIREIAEIMTWNEDRVERLIDRYVKRDELLKDRIRRMDEAEARTASAKLSAKPSGGKVPK